MDDWSQWETWVGLILGLLLLGSIAVAFWLV